MGVNTEDMVPRYDRKGKNYFEVNVVGQGLLIDYFPHQPKLKVPELPALAKMRLYPNLSVFINLEQLVVTVWGASRCSYKGRQGGYTEDRTVPNKSRRPLHIEEIPPGKTQRVLFHFEANHPWVHGSRAGMNTFLLLTNPIQIYIERSYVSVMYAHEVLIWNGPNPNNLIRLRDNNEYVADFRPDERFLTENAGDHKVPPFTKAP